MSIAIQRAIKGQYHAGLAMLRQSIERCPDELWGRTLDAHPRTFWRIAYHAIFYTHLYLQVSFDAFRPWSKDVWHGPVLWLDEGEQVPPEATPYTQSELIAYLDELDASLDEYVDALDFASPTSGFDWYKIPKLDHQLVNLRHLGIHVGQLQEHLYANGVDVDWIGRR